jgi:RNA ligase (TIGR02306 family)
MRKLASIQIVSEINPHPKADLIELAMVNGWQIVVKKGDFSPGDKAIYFEIDSFLPVRPEFEFLRGGCFRTLPNLGDGFRLRTIKLRGELSQGLLLPVAGLVDPNLPVDTDVTDLLGVQKWEVPLPTELAGLVRGNFPSWIRKTDQERVQNCWDEVALVGVQNPSFRWIMEEKLDGSSCSVYYNSAHGLGVCSRNWDLKLEGNETNAFVRTATRDGYFAVLEKLKMSIAIQGELCGPGIQGNPYKLNQTEFFVFDIWLVEHQRHATKSERNELLSMLVAEGVKVKEVPYLDSGRLPLTITECLKMADGKSLLNNKANREGIVFKGDRVIGNNVPSFKAISNLFLLKEKE